MCLLLLRCSSLVFTCSIRFRPPGVRGQAVAQVRAAPADGTGAQSRDDADGPGPGLYPAVPPPGTDLVRRARRLAGREPARSHARPPAGKKKKKIRKTEGPGTPTDRNVGESN